MGGKLMFGGHEMKKIHKSSVRNGLEIKEHLNRAKTETMESKLKFDDRDSFFPAHLLSL